MKRNHFLFSIFLVLIFWRCAAVAPPSGGPKDTTPPYLLSADPPSGTVRLLNQTIILQFSEYMDEKSFIEGIRFSPFLQGDHQILFKGDRVHITFPEGVRNEMTVVMTLSRDIKDEHGVEMAKAVQLAYSTGDEINNGVIRGRVFGESASAVYLFHDDQSDSLLLKRPNYIAEAEDDGAFEFSFLAEGEYKVLAIERGAVGAVLDKSRMSYGVTHNRLVELDSIFSNVHLRLFKEEQPLKVLRSEWKDQNWGELSFNKQLDRNAHFSSLYFNEHALKWNIHSGDSSKIVFAIEDTVIKGKGELVIGQISSNGQVMMDPTSINASIPSDPDTNHLSIVMPNKNKISITPDKSGPLVEIQFSKPQWEHLKHFSLEMNISDSIKVDLKKKYKPPMSISFIPTDGWKAKERYTVSLSNDNDRFERQTLKDSIFTFEIETTREQGYGGIIGSLDDHNRGNLISKLINTENTKWNFSSIVNSDGHFEYVDIPEGSYTLLIFEDRDGNESYSYGNAFPFEPSEWFYFSPDTIEVRSNWDIELPLIFMEK